MRIRKITKTNIPILKKMCKENGHQEYDMAKVDFAHSYIATEKGEVVAYIVSQPTSLEETPRIVDVQCEEAIYYWHMLDAWCKEGYGEILRDIGCRMHNSSIEGNMEMAYWFTPDQGFERYFDENDIYIMPVEEDGEVKYWVH